MGHNNVDTVEGIGVGVDGFTDADRRPELAPSHQVREGASRREREKKRTGGERGREWVREKELVNETLPFF